MLYQLMYRLKNTEYKDVRSFVGKISEIMTEFGNNARKLDEFQLIEVETGQTIAANRGDAVIIYGDMPVAFGSFIKEFRARKGREEFHMAVNRKKAEESKNIEQAQELVLEVLRAKDFTKDGEDGCQITFDLKVNSIVTIYGCWYREGKDKSGKDYQMVSFPSQKGKDGKYYNHAYLKLQQSDVDFISKEIEKLL